ncbi:MAG: hypothetical protein WC551_06215 [Patescibacteria group bacterium]
MENLVFYFVSGFICLYLAILQDVRLARLQDPVSVARLKGDGSLAGLANLNSVLWISLALAVWPILMCCIIRLWLKDSTIVRWVVNHHD